MASLHHVAVPVKACSYCAGHGYVPAEDAFVEPCPQCAGSGSQIEEETMHPEGCSCGAPDCSEAVYEPTMEAPAAWTVIADMADQLDAATLDARAAQDWAAHGDEERMRTALCRVLRLTRSVKQQARRLLGEARS